MSDVFDLDKGVGIFIYGCGDVGRGVAHNLLCNDYNVRGFIDRAAEEIKICDGLSVYSIADIQKVLQSDDIIAVVLNNGMHHDKVAETLFQHGADKIIYSPMIIRSTYEHRQFLRRTYKFLLLGEFQNIKSVPKFGAMRDSKARIIAVNDENICFWCPVTSIEIREHYLTLFEWLNGKSVDLKQYFNAIYFNLPHLRNSLELRRRWLNGRKELISIYEDALKYDMLFFTDAPSPAVWNEATNQFKLTDGNTRAHYLIYKGYDCVPVITTLRDFESQQNMER